MRVDTKRLDLKNIVLTGGAILIALLMSNLSLAGVVDVVQDELNEHDVLSCLNNDRDSCNSAATSSAYTSGTSSGSASSTDKNIVSTSNHASSANHKEPVKTDLYSQMKRYADFYNNGIDDVPDVVKKVAGNDVILIDIAMKDSSDLRIKARTKDGMIVEFRKLSQDDAIDPSVTLTGDENTIRAILKSDDPLGYFVTSLNQGSLKVECRGFLKMAALSALKAFA